MLSRFAARTFDQAFASQNDRADMDAYLEEAFQPAVQAAELAEPGAFVLIAEAGGVPVGYLHMTPSAPPACVSERASIELKRLYVDASCQGAGLGSRLLEEGLAQARAAGARSVWLGVWEHNAGAQRLYARHGFTRVGEHTFLLGRDPQTDWIMEKLVRW